MMPTSFPPAFMFWGLFISGRQSILTKIQQATIFQSNTGRYDGFWQSTERIIMDLQESEIFVGAPQLDSILRVHYISEEGNADVHR